MQQQQMYSELRRLRQTSEKLRDQNEDLKEDLKDMTQRYLLKKQENSHLITKLEKFQNAI